jgi:hypothetical protein
MRFDPQIPLLFPKRIALVSAPAVLPQLASRMLVGPAPGSRHLLPILANSIDYRLTFLLRCTVLDIAQLYLTRGSSSRRQRTRFESERQLSPDEFDDIALPDLTARLRPLPIDLDVPACHGSRRQAARFVKAREPQPSIDAQ